jgi:thiol-disulfide isomerase/thioredoxin
MTPTLALGPLTLPFSLLLVLAVMVLAPMAGQLVARRLGTDLESMLFRVMVAGLVVARLVYVVRYNDSYLQSPLDILDIRDGGWAPWAGVAAAMVAAIIVAVRRAALRKPLTAAFGTAALIWVLGTVALDAMTRVEGRLPAASLRGLDGGTVALAGFAGKPTVVNLWATWCPPCRREMPVLQEAQAARPDVNFVFLNQGEPPEKVRAFLDAQQWALGNVLLDARGEVAKELGVHGLPTTLFYDASGRLVDARVGELSRATLTERLASASREHESP